MHSVYVLTSSLKGTSVISKSKLNSSPYIAINPLDLLQDLSEKILILWKAYKNSERPCLDIEY